MLDHIGQTWQDLRTDDTKVDIGVDVGGGNGFRRGSYEEASDARDNFFCSVCNNELVLFRLDGGWHAR